MEGGRISGYRYSTIVSNCLYSESSDVDVELRRRTFMSIAQTLNIIAL